MLVNVYLEGYLAKFVKGGHVTVDAFNARDALEKLQNFMPKGVKHLVKVKELGCVDDLDEVKETLTIIPLFEGGGGGGKRAGGIQIGIGILLITLLAFTGVGAAVGAGMKSFLMGVGANLIIGGALQLLQKSPKADPTQGDKKSRFINGDKNTIKEGTPIPLIYGRQKVYPHILSFNIDADAYNPDDE
jgi:predicted phage tail protein